MEIGTYYVKEYEAKALEILSDIIQHGFGEVTIQINETKNYKTKILIVAGRSWVYFIDKAVPQLDKGDIL